MRLPRQGNSPMTILKSTVQFIQSQWEGLLLGSGLLVILVSVISLLIPAPELVVALHEHPEMAIAKEELPDDGILMEAQAVSEGLLSESLNSSALSSDSDETDKTSKLTQISKKAPGKVKKGPKRIPIVNLNTAGPHELDELPGVGPKLAQRILEYRRGVTRFQSVEDIMSVKGVGPKNFEKMKPYLKI